MNPDGVPTLDAGELMNPKAFSLFARIPKEEYLGLWAASKRHMMTEAALGQSFTSNRRAVDPPRKLALGEKRRFYSVATVPKKYKSIGLR